MSSARNEEIKPIPGYIKRKVKLYLRKKTAQDICEEAKARKCAQLRYMGLCIGDMIDPGTKTTKQRFAARCMGCNLRIVGMSAKEWAMKKKIIEGMREARTL